MKNNNIESIINSLNKDISMLDHLALYSKSSAELIVIIVHTSSFLSLLGIAVSKPEKKYIELKPFVHSDDYDLFSFEFLSDQKSEHFSLNFRIIKEDGTVAVVAAALEKMSSGSIDKAIVFKATIRNAKSLLTKSVLDKASNTNFSAMLYHSNDFIFFKDLHHTYTASSQTMADITGYRSGDEHIGLTDYDIFPKEHADNYYRLEKIIYEGKQAFVEDIQPFYDGSGNEGWVNNRKYPIKNESGDIIGLFGIARIQTEEILTKRKLEEAQEKLRILANLDHLTSLPNRRHGYELCKKAVSEANRYKSPLSLIMSDIDYFKKINDSYGHDCGDEVLAFLGKVAAKIIREPDIIFRYGGEEFVICLPNTNLSEAINFMGRLNKVFNRFRHPKIKTPITMSSGIALLTEGESFEDLITKTDKLLYKAKSSGRDCYKY